MSVDKDFASNLGFFVLGHGVVLAGALLLFEGDGTGPGGSAAGELNAGIDGGAREGRKRALRRLSSFDVSECSAET